MLINTNGRMEIKKETDCIKITPIVGGYRLPSVLADEVKNDEDIIYAYVEDKIVYSFIKSHWEVVEC